VRCWCCGSEGVALADGGYICAECGTVLGREVEPPRWAESALKALERGFKVALRTKYSLIVEYYIYAICQRLNSLGKTHWERG